MQSHLDPMFVLLGYAPPMGLLIGLSVPGFSNRVVGKVYIPIVCRKLLVRETF